MKVIDKYSTFGGGNQNPDKLIIHSMSEYINSMHCSDFLQTQGLSAHFLISPNGDLIKCRSTTMIGYHAKGYNRNSIGIEVLVDGDNSYAEFKKKIISGECFTNEQYLSLIEISKNIMDYWGISIDNVLRHSDISPERKVDPGVGFKWDWFKSQLL